MVYLTLEAVDRLVSVSHPLMFFSHVGTALAETLFATLLRLPFVSALSQCLSLVFSTHPPHTLLQEVNPCTFLAADLNS